MKPIHPTPQTPSDRLLLVLSTLAQSHRPLSVGELVDSTGLARSTIYRQLAYLKQWGFAQESREAYAPGPACVQLGQGFDAASPLVRQARPEMEWLMRRHFQKSQSLEPKEFKCLSLIFIDRVANYKGESPKIKFLQKNTNKFIPSFMM